MPATTAETLSLVTRNVSVAPLVLLSVVDHYNRTEAYKSKTKRVVGVLLGQNDGKNARVSNSFAGAQHCPSSVLPDCLLTSSHSALRGRRQGPVGLVPGPQLRRGDERHVQEGQCAREANRVVPLGPEAAGVGSRGQRTVQALHSQPAAGHYRCPTEGGRRSHGCVLCCGRDQGCMWPGRPRPSRPR